VLHVTGEGGLGKSLLLRYLRERCCHRVDEAYWSKLRKERGAAFSTSFVGAATADPVPAAHLDFSLPPTSDHQPQDRVGGLVALRQGLVHEHGLRFPRFDYAYLIYLDRLHSLTRERFAQFFPAVETVRLLENLVETLPFLGPLLATVRLLAGVVPREAGKVGPWVKAVDASFAGRVAGLDPHAELAAELADYFAADLRAEVTHPGGPPRVALFLDGLDGFWSRADEFSPFNFHALDEWVRRLLLGLFREGPSGVVVVAASRKPPTWEKASPFPVPRKVLRSAPLGPLGREDSEEFLELVGVEKATTRRALVDYTWIETGGPTRRGGPGGAHPLLLRLAAEVAQAAPGRSWDASNLDRALTEAGKVGELLTWLLRFTDRSTGEALQAVAVARSFDQDIYNHLGNDLKFETSPARFAKITAISLCWALPGGPGRFRVHDLVRRLIAGAEAPEENALKAHLSLEAYHRRLLPTNPLAIIEVLYHQTYSDEKAAAETWNEDFFDAVERSDLSTCAALLEVWAHVFRRVRGHPRADALSEIADYLALVSRHDEARGFYKEALAAYSEALAPAPRNPIFLGDRALALRGLADLEALLGRHDEARGFLVEALAAYSEALALDPRNPILLSNRAVALQSLAHLEATLGRHDEAREFYKEALAASSEALVLAPQDPVSLGNRASALQRLADLEAKLGRHDEARGFLVEALAAYSEALALAPRNPTALGNRASALQSLAALEAKLGRHDEARGFLVEALAAYSEALALAPQNPFFLGNRAMALWRLANLEAELGRHDEARGFYKEALAAYSEALALAPQGTLCLGNRALALVSLADLEANLGRHDEARGFYKEALAAYSEALALAPRKPGFLGNRAAALQSLADLEAKLGRHDEARGFLVEALAASSEALALALRNPVFLGNRASALQGLADLEANLGRHDEARGFYKAALAASSEALTLAPRNPVLLANRALALQRLADLEAELGRHDEARGFYKEALAGCLELLRIVPGHPGAQSLRLVLERRLAGKK